MIPTEADILATRMNAARTEEQAAAVRLQTAYLEQEASRRTIRMANAVAESMVQNQLGGSQCRA
jgi:hypothetical protein